MLEFGTATSADVIGTKVTKEELIHFVIQCGGGRKKVQKKFYKIPSGCFFTVELNIQTANLKMQLMRQTHCDRVLNCSLHRTILRNKYLNSKPVCLV